MRILLQGQLEAGMLANLLQYLTLNEVSGVLQLRNARNRVGEIFFKDGNIVHAESGSLLGVEAIAAVSIWGAGGFNFRTDVAAPQHSLQLSLNNLLLEVSRQANMQLAYEAQQDQEGLSADTVLTPIVGNQNQNTVELRLQALHLFMQIDGARSLGDIAIQLGIPIEGVLDVANELIDEGYVEFASSPAVSGDFVSGLSDLVRDFMESIDEETDEEVILAQYQAAPANADAKQQSDQAVQATNQQAPDAAPAQTLGPHSIIKLLPVVQNQGTVELRPETLDFLTQLDAGGPRSLGDIATVLDEPVARIVGLAEQLLSQGLIEAAASPAVSEEFLTALTRLFGNFMGPLARIFLEDAFESLELDGSNVPQDKVPAVLSNLRNQLERKMQKQAFDRQVRRLCEKYGLADEADRYIAQHQDHRKTRF